MSGISARHILNSGHKVTKVQRTIHHSRAAVDHDNIADGKKFSRLKGAMAADYHLSVTQMRRYVYHGQMPGIPLKN